MAEASCVTCGGIVPHERVNALRQMSVPITCIEHGDQYQPTRTGFNVYSHKTAGECVIVDGTGESLRQARRADRRSR